MGSAVTKLGDPNDRFVPEDDSTETRSTVNEGKTRVDIKDKNYPKPVKQGTRNENLSENKNKSNIDRNPVPDNINSNEQRLILLGSIGSGKSATGNSILSKYVFESMFSPKLITKQNVLHSAKILQTKVVVVDTPGIHVSDLHKEEYRWEVKESLDKAITLVSPGPHAFLLVVSIPRFSELDVQIVHFIKHHLKNILDHIIIIFTGSDFLYEKNKQLRDFKEELPVVFKDFIQYQCDNRVILFTNTITAKSGGNIKDNNGQVAKLLQKVKDMTKTSGISHDRKLPVIQQDEKLANAPVPYLKTGFYVGHDKPIPGTEFLHAEYWKAKNQT